MQLITIDGLNPASVEAVVGERTYRRGLAYARRRAVLHMTWDDAEDAVHALVRGSDGGAYETAVYLQAGHQDDLEFAFGECSCPVGLDCKHAVAVAVMAAGAPGRPAELPAAGTPSWERTLDELLTPSLPAEPAGAVPLALELALHVPPAAGRRDIRPARPKLLARLVKPGRTGWVGGGLTWSKIGSPYSAPDGRAAHVRLLRELYLMHQSRTRSDYHYYGDDKTIDLAELGDRLWPVLDEAAVLGLELVRPRKALGPLAPYGQAELSLDVTAGAEPGSLVVSPSMRLTGPDGPEQAIEPVAFLGHEGHGVLYVTPGQAAGNPAEWPFQLARLVTLAPPTLQRLALSGQRLSVPAGQRGRFAKHFWPRLRHLARVESSDDAFTPPTISAPTLVLHADYGAEHETVLSWQWAYEVGEQPMRAPLGRQATGEGFRDQAAERRTLAALAGPLTEFGLTADEPAPATRLHGMDTVRFRTEVLPLLAGRSEVRVEHTGEPATYREAGDSLQIAVSTDPVAGDRDWFDLGVRISVEGRQVPFADRVHRTCRGRDRICCCPTGPTSPCKSPSCGPCAR